MPTAAFEPLPRVPEEGPYWHRIFGTDQYGSWIYARALNANTAGGWHHCALVWATAGISGVEIGRRRAAIYVDGKLNTGYWAAASATSWRCRPTVGSVS
jgi:hypothetical protein